MRRYFVDEAGDPVLFSKRGHRLLVGTEGCSRFFIIGLLHVREPVTKIEQRLEALRKELMTDPYLSAIPSMQPEARKTAHAFHAKDDVPEVRREVYRLLIQQNVRFFAAVKDKLTVARYVRERGESDRSYRYRPDELYDYVVRRLFKDRLHTADEYDVCFAEPGEFGPDRSASASACGCAGEHGTFVRSGRVGEDQRTLATRSLSPRAAGCRLLPLGTSALLREEGREIPALCLGSSRVCHRHRRHKKT